MKRRGFTLVEIMIVVGIIGLLAALASVVYLRSSEKTKATSLVNDLRVYSQTFDSYFFEKDDYSRSEGRNREFPAGLDDRLRDSWNAPVLLAGCICIKSRIERTLRSAVPTFSFEVSIIQNGA